MRPIANPSALLAPEPKDKATFPSRIIDALFRWKGYDSPMTHKEAVNYLCSIAQATRYDYTQRITSTSLRDQNVETDPMKFIIRTEIPSL